MRPIKVGILITSDRSHKGERPDLTTPILTDNVSSLGWTVITTSIVPDEIDRIVDILVDWTDNQLLDLILTSGGTGFSPRDVTPEATLKVMDRNTPGLSEAMRARGMAANPHAMLSRAVAGIRKSTLIINLPGSPAAALENFLVIAPALPHAVELLQDQPDAEEHHRR